MLLKQAKSGYWKKRAAKHEYEELLKGGMWLEPALALLRKKTNKEWIDKRRRTAGKLVLERGWVQKRLFDIGWSDESKCQACHNVEGTEKHKLHRCPEWCEVRREITDLQKVGAKSENLKEGVEIAKGIVTHPSSQ